MHISFVLCASLSYFALAIAATPPPLKCEPPLVFQRCGMACNSTCEVHPRDEVCNMMCVSRCGCPRNTPIYLNGRCIAYKDCQSAIARPELTRPQPPRLKCTSPFVYQKCGSDCNRTCADGPMGAVCNMKCVTRCGCPYNKPVYHDGRCIAYSQCESEMAKAEHTTPEPPRLKCTPPLVYQICGSSCNRTCADGPRGGSCNMMCTTKCGCPYNKPVYHEGRCIAYSQCESEMAKAEHTTPAPRLKCTPPLVYQICGSTCNRTCADGPRGGICNMMCTTKCGCPDNKPVHHEGSCIAYRECPSLETRSTPTVRPSTQGSRRPATRPSQKPAVKPSKKPTGINCPEPQVFRVCGRTCNRTCKYADRPPVCDRSCKARCECPSSKPIWHNEKCIAAAECPGRSGASERNLEIVNPIKQAKEEDAKKQILDVLESIRAVIEASTRG